MGIHGAERPWDPPLADNGRDQARAAAKRLSEFLLSVGIPAPTRIFTSPLVRCVQTANFVAEEFAVESLLVEGGLVETICEAWMRQWALPDADSTWGGPPGGSMPKDQAYMYSETMVGPPIEKERLHPSAITGTKVLLRTAAELKDAGFDKVDPTHR